MSLDIYLTAVRPTVVFETNITHNLNAMAEECGLYKALWRPEELHIKHASELIPLLEGGITNLEYDPEKYKKLNPSNGWGDYDGLLRVAKEYLKACKENPDAEIEVSR